MHLNEEKYKLDNNLYEAHKEFYTNFAEYEIAN